MVTTGTDLLALEADEDVVTVRLSRPDSLNALNPEMIEGLVDVFEQLHDDPGRGVLLTGEGRVTCAGMDREIVGGGNYSAEYGDLNATLGRLYDLAASYPAPVAIAGRGALVGAGSVLSLSVEFLVLGAETTYSFPEVQFRIASERIAGRLPAIAGRRVAAELALTGEPIDPERAKSVGLVNDVVPEDAVEARARELLETVCAHDRETVATLVGYLWGADAQS